MVTTLGGLVGGLLGSVAMAAAARATDDGPSPAAEVWAMYAGDGDPENYPAQGLAVHLVYGTLAGGAFAGLTDALSLGLVTPWDALFWSVVWAAFLAAVAAGVWLHVFIGAKLETERIARLAGLHLVYGVGLGLVAYVATGL